jgi:adenylylsulfate kinase-like enzyme
MRHWETKRQGAEGGILGGFQFQCGNLRFLALNRTDRFQPQRASPNPHLVSPLNTSPIHWLFGRSSAGKTTLAKILQSHWRSQGWPTLLLDGDDLRSGVCAGLGFSRADRLENHRRMAEIAKLAAS